VSHDTTQKVPVQRGALFNHELEDGVSSRTLRIHSCCSHCLHGVAIPTATGGEDDNNNHQLQIEPPQKNKQKTTMKTMMSCLVNFLIPALPPVYKNKQNFLAL